MVKKILNQKYILLFIILVSIGIELILSNITYLNVLSCDKRNVVSDISQNKTGTIYIPTQGIQVQNIKIYYKNEKSMKGILKYTPSVVVYGLENNIRKLENRFSISNTNKRINIHAENDTLELYLNILEQSTSRYIKIDQIEKIVLNDLHLEFSIIRALGIGLVLTLLVVIKKNKHLKYDKTSKKQSRIFYGMAIFLYILILVEIHLAKIPYNISENKIDTYHFNFLNAQIEAIINGQSEMMLEPEKKLLSLPNPYDNSLRMANARLNIYTDYSLYHNKLYSYFGLAPLILMFPYHIITGNYLSNFFASFILLFFMIILLAKLYKMLIDRYIQKVSFMNVIVGFLTIFFVSSIPFLARGMVYDIEQVCGLIFIILSYILLLSIYNNPNKKLYLKVVLCSLCIGLIVLSKPSYILYYILFGYMLFGLRKIISREDLIRVVKIFIIPISILAFIQIYWNYIRFSSIFSFGNEYQLTVMDPDNLMYISPIKFIKGLFQYLFQLPEVDPSNFPFLFAKPVKYINVDMDVILYDVSVLGIFIVPFAWIFLFYKKLHLHFSKEFNHTITIFSIITILLLFLNIRNGVAESYIIDVKLFLYMFAVLIFFKLMEEKKELDYQSIFYIFCVISILITLPIGITLNQIDFQIIDTEFKVYLKNLFQFWL